MSDKTKAQLEAENAELRRLLAEAEADRPTGAGVERPRPVMPSFGLSEGTRLDILEAQAAINAHPRLTEIMLAEPFTGKRIKVTANGAELEGADELEPDDELVDDLSDQNQ
jgi:hypothetical protein